MKPEQQRIKIAEACEWTGIAPYHNDGPLWGVSKHGSLNAIPDYLNDLNAMNDAEAVLTDEQHGVFRRYLAEIVNKRNDTSTRLMSAVEYRAWFTATASQRAEAFLRALGLWEEEA